MGTTRDYLSGLVSPSTTQASPRNNSRVRSLFVGVAAVSLSLAFCLLVLEFSLARFYYSNVDELRQDEFDGQLGWRLKPGEYTVKAPQAFFKYSVFINRMNLRHPELTPSTPSGTRRIIVLGDSFTFGQLVNDETLFSHQLERSLNKQQREVKYEVINAGVPGYGTAQELILLRRLAKAGIVGDVYVLNIFTNDILDNLRLDYSSRSENPLQPGFRLHADGSLTFEHRPRRVLRENSNLVAVREPPTSKLLSVVKIMLQSLAQTEPGLVKLARNLGMDVSIPRVPGIISAWYDDDVLHKGVPLMRALLQEIKTTVVAEDAVLLVTLIPSPMQVHISTYGQVLRASFPDDPMANQFLADPLRPQRIIRKMCDELGLPFLDMYDELAAQEQSFYIPIDGHFNKAGHTAFAKSLEGFVGAFESAPN